jgi:hypothetical protein
MRASSAEHGRRRAARLANTNGQSCTSSSRRPAGNALSSKMARRGAQEGWPSGHQLDRGAARADSKTRRRLSERQHASGCRLATRSPVVAPPVHVSASASPSPKGSAEPVVFHHGLATPRHQSAISISRPISSSRRAQQCRAEMLAAQRTAVKLRPHPETEGVSAGEERARGTSPRARGWTLQVTTRRGRQLQQLVGQPSC